MQFIGIAATILVGLCFFSLRCRAPFWYGMFEVLVSMAVIWFVFFPVSTSYLRLIAPGPGPFETAFANSVGLLAGIYILVRGLDNMDRDLPSLWRPLSDKLFRGNTNSSTS